MALSDRLLPLAKKLITKFGTTISLTTVTNGAYNPATSSTINTSSSKTLNCIIEEYSDNLRFLGTKTEAGTTIVEGDKKITIAGSDVSSIPTIADYVTIGSTIYSIIGIASQYVDNYVAYYVLHVRKN